MENILKAAKFIKEGKIVAFPTETVYGLAADPRNEKALKKLYELKKRPLNKSFIVHLGKISDVEKVAVDIPKSFYLLAEKFFPGPLTLVLRKNPGLSPLISNDDTIAVRMPNHSMALRLIELVGYPIIGTSANLSGQDNLFTAKDVEYHFKEKLAAILDGGECSLKTPSTILSLLIKKPLLLRRGSITYEEIEKVIISNV